MLRRTYPSDFWQSVTGSLEWGEKPYDTAVRELWEETGLVDQNILDCHNSQTFEIFSFWRERYAPGVEKNLEYVFRVELPRKLEIKLDPKEHEEFQWLSRERAIELAFSHTNKAAIQRWVPE